MSSDADAKALATTKDIMTNGGGCKVVRKVAATVTEAAVAVFSHGATVGIDGGTGLLNKVLSKGGEAYCKAAVKEQY